MTTNSTVLDLLARRESAEQLAASATREAALGLYWASILEPSQGKASAAEADRLTAALRVLGRSLSDLQGDAKAIAKLAAIAADHDMATHRANAKEANAKLRDAYARAAELKKEAETLEAEARFQVALADSALHVAQQAQRDGERLRDELRLRGCPPCPQVPAPPEPVPLILAECVALPPVDSAFQRPMILVGGARRRLGDRFEVDAETLAEKGAFLRAASELDAERAAEAERAAAEQRAAIAALQAAEEVADEPNPTIEADGFTVGGLEGDDAVPQGDVASQQVPEPQPVAADEPEVEA